MEVVEDAMLEDVRIESVDVVVDVEA